MMQVSYKQVQKPSAPSDTRPVIAHVIHAMGVGGAEVLVDQMVRRLDSEYRCVVAVLDDIGLIGHRLRADGFIVEHLNRQPGIDRACAKRLCEFADRQGASILHAHQYTPFFQAMLSRGLTGSRPVLFTEHGRHFPDLPSRKRMAVNRMLLRRCDRLVGCGQAVRQALIDNEGLPDGRVEVVYNGVDLTELGQPSSGARKRIRSEFSLVDNDFVAIQVARLNALKDHQTALRAVHRLIEAMPNFKLLIAGDGEERGAIEATIHDLKLGNHVLLAGTRKDVADLLAASDMFLMTSISEGIPLTIIEAMAAGVPVVSTDVGGIPEMVTHEHSGLLTRAGDDQALAAAISRMQKDDALRENCIRNGLQVAQQKFSLDTMLNGYKQIYSEMLSARKS